jgi:hypothetical protein
VRPGAVSVEGALDRTRYGRWLEDESPAIAAQPLVGGWVMDQPAESAAIALRRVSLGPGERAPLTATGPLALTMETGALTVAAGSGLIWQQHPDGDEWIAPATEAMLLPGEGALFQRGATAIIRNDGSGPLLLLELDVIAADDGPASTQPLA